MKKQIFLLLLMLTVFSRVAYPQTAIGNVEDLRSMTMDGSYYLTDDLEVSDWVPMGIFTGSFDGRGHVITVTNGLVDQEGNAGFFGRTQGAVISNLIVGGHFRNITGYGGSLVAHAVNTTIVNCETEASLLSECTMAICGGLVGCLQGGGIINSSSNATLEGFKVGGMVGSVIENAFIRNSFSNATIVFSSKFGETEVGLLVHDNAGVLENNYVDVHSSGWYVPSLEQLCMLMAGHSICNAGNHFVEWTAGFIASSTMSAKDRIYGCNEKGELTTRDQSYFMSSVTTVKYIHDFHAIGYNIGDIIYVGGVKSFVFYVNEDGHGGLVTPFLDNHFMRLFTSKTSNQLDGYYNSNLYIEAINYDHAQWHGGQVAHGGTTLVIPEAYQEDLGKFFTYHLQEQDHNPNTLLNRIKIKESSLTANSSVKQLAYTNTGTINYCYYPFSTSVFALVNGNAVTRCCRYDSEGAPYNYGEFGARLYVENNISDYALCDTLNGWVSTQGVADYASWTVAGDNQINENMPIHRFDFHNGETSVNTAIKKGRTNWFKALRYASLNHLSSEQTVSVNTLAYYGHCDAITANNVTNPWESPLFITEEAALKGSYQLNANVVITFDNSDASGFAGAPYDWHSVSTPLSNAPVGIDYTMYTNGGAENNPSQVTFNRDNGYFPLDTPYQGWDFYCYDEPNNGWPNFKRKTGDHYHHETGVLINYTNETSLIPGKGYLWALGKKTGLQAYGKLNNGNVRTAVTRQGTAYPGYNLIGNPYQAFLDFDGFASDNAGILAQKAYTLLDADKQGYITYCTGSSANPLYASRYLHSHQGFFVQVNRNGNVVFKTSQTLVEAASSFREEQPTYPLVNLVVTDAKGRNDYATAELDRPESGGALKMKGLRGGDSEVSFSRDFEEYSIAFIEGRPKILPVHFTAHAEGAYTLRWDLRNEEFDYLHLIDNITGTEVDCLAQESYVFQASPTDYASRFKLVFAPSGVEENGDLPLQGKYFAYLSNHTLVVEGQGRLDLLDLQGRLLKSATVNERQNGLSVEGLAQGVYLLRLTESNMTRVQKIIIP